MKRNFDWSKVGFVGVAGAGKDEAGKVLLGLDYQRHNLGDLIKRDLDPIVQKRRGFSAFTENRVEKERFRSSLEYVGNDFYDSYMAEYWLTAPKRMFSTRVQRAKEGQMWRERDHPLILVKRTILNPYKFMRTIHPYLWLEPKTEFERQTMQEIMPYVTHTIINDSSISLLQDRVEELLERNLYPLKPTKPSILRPV